MSRLILQSKSVFGGFRTWIGTWKSDSGLSFLNIFSFKSFDNDGLSVGGS